MFLENGFFGTIGTRICSHIPQEFAEIGSIVELKRSSDSVSSGFRPNFSGLSLRNIRYVVSEFKILESGIVSSSLRSLDQILSSPEDDLDKIAIQALPEDGVSHFPFYKLKIVHSLLPALPKLPPIGMSFDFLFKGKNMTAPVAGYRLGMDDQCVFFPQLILQSSDGTEIISDALKAKTPLFTRPQLKKPSPVMVSALIQ